MLKSPIKSKYKLRSEKIQTHEQISLWKVAEGEGLNVPAAEQQVELREGTLAFGLRLVEREVEAAHGRAGEGVGERLREVEAVCDERAVQVHARRVFCDAGNLPVPETEVRQKVVDLEVEVVAA
jgi:hypothetical protein